MPNWGHAGIIRKMRLEESVWPIFLKKSCKSPIVLAGLWPPPLPPKLILKTCFFGGSRPSGTTFIRPKKKWPFSFQNKIFSRSHTIVVYSFHYVPWIIGYILGDMFSSVYGMALDTIVICSILDTEIMKRANMDAYF